MKTDTEVVRQRAANPTALACTQCEGIEFKVYRTGRAECLRCGFLLDIVLDETPQHKTRMAKDDVASAIDDAISDLEMVRDRL